MSPVIRISDEIYARLEKHVEGFDTPTGVIEKLLNHYEGKKPKKAHIPAPAKGKPESVSSDRVILIF
ncbi:MAG: hypothetical protein KZQ58_11360 [gamma proteobacterium symbiont of Bathyaustriella thionipta]|nr:hypothetical protein [gamma proteobacterium symbiont of Bathyaustriella thionipta]